MAEKLLVARCARCAAMFVKPTIDETTWEDLETALLTADFGPDITERIIDELREKVDRYRTTDPARPAADAEGDARGALREVRHDAPAHRAPGRRARRRRQRRRQDDDDRQVREVPAALRPHASSSARPTPSAPRPSTSSRPGPSAGERRSSGPSRRARIRHPSPSRRSTTPSAPAPRSCSSTPPGRLHTKGGLMDELGKIRRVIEKQAPISEVLLVLDATTGQNGVMQAQAFLEHAGVTGLVLTKLDGSAKGGFVLAVQERTGIPVKLLGQGEGIGDLTGFTPHVFAASLVD